MTLLRVGGEAPAFMLSNLDGEETNLEMRSPGLKALVFYKAACPTCRFSMPLFDRLFESSPSRVYAVAQDPIEEARVFRDDLGLRMPILVDPEPHPVSRAYQLLTVPTLFVIAAEAEVILASPAFIREDVEMAAALLADEQGRPRAKVFTSAEDIPAFKPG